MLFSDQFLDQEFYKESPAEKNGMKIEDLKKIKLRPFSQGEKKTKFLTAVDTDFFYFLYNT